MREERACSSSSDRRDARRVLGQQIRDVVTTRSYPSRCRRIFRSKCSTSSTTAIVHSDGYFCFRQNQRSRGACVIAIAIAIGPASVSLSPSVFFYRSLQIWPVEKKSRAGSIPSVALAVFFLLFLSRAGGTFLICSRSPRDVPRDDPVAGFVRCVRPRFFLGHQSLVGHRDPMRLRTAPTRTHARTH